jgi:hypothetical protein
MSMWSPPWSEELSLFGSDRADGIRVWLMEEVEPLRGACWIPDISEWPSGGEGFLRVSLSEVLQQIDADAPYWLSPKACQGILRRAGRRGKALPEALQTALEARAQF